MNPNSTTYQAYVQILKEELLPAMGCTEPIAIAYCAARARAVLGALPDAIEVEASGNIIKNVKSVVVPNTEGRKGLEAAAAIGVLGGDADKGYEVIASISSEVKKQLGPYLEATPIMVRPANSDYVLDVSVLARSGEHYALVRAVNEHTNIVRIEKDAQVLLNRHPSETMENENRALLNIRDIYDFAKTADLGDVRDVLSQQIRYNSAISAEGLRGDYGANIGRTLLRAYGSNVRIRARAAAGHHQLRQRQPGHDSLSAGHRIRTGTQLIGGRAVSRVAGIEPRHAAPEDRHWPTECLLRRRECGRGRGRRHCLSLRRGLCNCGTYRHQRGGRDLRDCVRRSKGLLCRQDLRCGGRRYHGL